MSEPHASAQRLLQEFGDIGSTVAASAPRLSRACGPDQASAHAIGWFARTMRQVLQARIASGPVVDGSRSLLQYLAGSMAHLPTEEIRALFLNAGNRLISDEVVAIGCVSEVHLRDRRLVARALELGAAALVLVHNHPGGDPMPSAADVAGTKLLDDLCARLGIRLHDHLIVASGGIRSLRAMGALS